MMLLALGSLLFLNIATHSHSWANWKMFPPSAYSHIMFLISAGKRSNGEIVLALILITCEYVLLPDFAIAQPFLRFGVLATLATDVDQAILEATNGRVGAFGLRYASIGYAVLCDGFLLKSFLARHGSECWCIMLGGGCAQRPRRSLIYSTTLCAFTYCSYLKRFWQAKVEIESHPTVFG